MGRGIGLGIGVFILILLDRLDDRIGTLSELEEIFHEEVLGHIPREKSALRKGEPGLLQPQDDRFAFVEAYRNLRSSLLYMSGPGQQPRTLLVTSSVPNDGKSLTSANLAITLASTGARVLLVDADLRKGSLHNRFGISAAFPGLSEALGKESDGEKHPGLRQNQLSRFPCPNHTGSAVPRKDTTQAGTSHPEEAQVRETELSTTSQPNWSSSVHVTKVPNLFLLPRGQTTHRSSELFLNQSTGRFLQEAMAAYDFVVLDTAPVMAADDVTSLAPRVDGVIFVVRAEHTSSRVARAALDLLYRRHVRVLGLVFNAVRPASADYYYYYKYKDYYNSYPAA